MEVSDQPYDPATLRLGKGNPHYASWAPQPVSTFGKEKNLLLLLAIDPRSLGGPARALPSLFRQYMIGAARKDSGPVPAASCIQPRAQ
jgi:hypothetical protein